MSNEWYLILMVGAVLLVTGAAAPKLLFKKCSHCGKWNGLDAKACRACGAEFPPLTP